MPNRGYTVDVNGNKQTTQTYVVFPGGTKGDTLRFRLPAGTKIELNDNDTGRAAKGLKFKRSGEDLHLALPGSSLATPDIVVEGFYPRGGKTGDLIGRGPDGKTYDYAGVGSASPAGRETATQIAGKTVTPWGSPESSIEPVMSTERPQAGAMPPTGKVEAAATGSGKVGSEAYAGPAAAAADEGGGFRLGTLGWVLGGVGLVGLAAAGGGGGGGGSSSGGTPSNVSDGPVSRVEAGAVGTDDDQVGEGKTLVFTVSLRDATQAPTNWSFALGGTATGVDLADVQFSDGVTLSNGSLTVPAGVHQFTVTVRTAEDSSIEANETLTVAVNGVTASTAIVDNDKPSVVSVETGAPGAADDRVVEGSPATLRITLSDPSPKAETYKLNFGGAISSEDVRVQSLSDGVTYDAATGLLTVPAQVSAFNLVLATPVDGNVEAAETISVQLDDRQGSLVIADLLPSSVASTSATEGSDLSFTVTLNGASPNATSHAFALTGAGATAGSDYGNPSFTAGVTLGANGTLLVPAGVTSFQVVVPTVRDNVVEGDEIVQVSVDGMQANGTIVANGSQAVTGVTASTQAVTEGGAVSYTVSLSGPSAKTESHVFKINDLAATNFGALAFSDGVSYNAGAQTLLVPAGVTAFTVTFTAADNTRDDPTQTLSVSLGGVVQPLSVADNDPAPVVSIAGPASLGEGAGTAGYTVSLAQASGQVVSVQVQTVKTGSDSADAGSDYAAVNQTVTFQPGTTSQTVAVNIINDTLVEANESYTVQLAQPVNATLGTASVATTIVDNDDPVATLSGPATVAEGAGTATYTVTLSHAATQAVTINYAAVAGTAAATDFAPTSGTLTIAAGQTTGSFKVGIVDDSIQEPTQSFSVQLSAPVHATLSNNSLSTAITDNGDVQAVTRVKATAANITEGETASYVVTVDAAEVASSHHVTVGGTATANADYGAVTVTGASYDAASGVVTVAAGVTQFTVNVATIDDRLFEFTETLTVTVDTASDSLNLRSNDSIFGGSSEPQALVVVDGSGSASIAYAEGATSTASAGTATPASAAVAAGPLVAHDLLLSSSPPTGLTGA